MLILQLFFMPTFELQLVSVDNKRILYLVLVPEKSFCGLINRNGATMQILKQHFKLWREWVL